jgi:hypothetical protein
MLAMGLGSLSPAWILRYEDMDIEMERRRAEAEAERQQHELTRLKPLSVRVLPPRSHERPQKTDAVLPQPK